MNTDLDSALPEFQELGFQVQHLCRDGWYTVALLRHSSTHRQIMLCTRTIRGGITLFPDPSPEEIAMIYRDPHEGIHGDLNVLRNKGFEHWSYQSEIGFRDWLQRNKIIP